MNPAMRDRRMQKNTSVLQASSKTHVVPEAAFISCILSQFSSALRFVESWKYERERPTAGLLQVHT